MRRYGTWAGNPQGTPEDVTRCIESVASDSRSPLFHQCRRKRGFGPDGLHCKQHAPDAKRARQEAARERYQAQVDRIMAPQLRADAFESVLREIANGHNDPRSLAAETLAKFTDN